MQSIAIIILNGKRLNKVRMSALFTLIQCSASSFRQCEKATHENKKKMADHQGISKITTTCSCCDCVHTNSQGICPKPLELLRDSNEVAVY